MITCKGEANLHDSVITFWLKIRILQMQVPVQKLSSLDEYFSRH